MNTSRIGALRKAKGWTQERLADVSGVAVRTIQRLESGQDANLETLRLIAGALGVEVGELFATVEKEETKMVIDTFDTERASQMQRREAEAKAYKEGLQIALSIVMFVLLAGMYFLFYRTQLPGSWILWPLWGLLWGLGAMGIRAFTSVRLAAKLDEKYPLTKGLNIEAQDTKK